MALHFGWFPFEMTSYCICTFWQIIIAIDRIQRKNVHIHSQHERCTAQVCVCACVWKLWLPLSYGVATVRGCWFYEAIFMANKCVISAFAVVGAVVNMLLLLLFCYKILACNFCGHALVMDCAAQCFCFRFFLGRCTLFALWSSSYFDILSNKIHYIAFYRFSMLCH